LQLPPSGTETFFLWGPRQAGKTTLLRATYPDALWIDFLKAEEYRRYLQNPELLRGELAVRTSVRQVVIDEVQKVPPILDEAHWLLENRGVQFALCGSSARKVKRGQANLLGGRGVRYELHGLTAQEIGGDFDLCLAVIPADCSSGVGVPVSPRTTLSFCSGPAACSAPNRRSRRFPARNGAASSEDARKYSAGAATLWDGDCETAARNQQHYAARLSYRW